MKKTCLLITFLIITNFLYSQWQPDLRLTIDPALSFTCRNNTKYVAASGDFLHVVWMDYRDGNFEVYYKRSTDRGIYWGADIRLTNDSASSNYPSLAISGLVVHAVWENNLYGNYQIFYKRSTNAGLSWDVDQQLTNYSLTEEFPSVSASGTNVHIAWNDKRDGNYEIYYKHSTDNGINWSEDIRLTNNSLNSEYASISAFGQVVCVVWQERSSVDTEIYYKRSTDRGLSWGADLRLSSNNVYTSKTPSISVSDMYVIVVWEDHRDGNEEIYYRLSTDEGLNWGADNRLTSNNYTSTTPSVLVSGPSIHLTWDDNRDGNKEIYYKCSTDWGLSWGEDIRLTSNSSYSYFPSIAISGPFVQVVWNDSRDGNPEIYGKRNPTGNPNWIKFISSEIPNNFSLSQNYPNPFNPQTKIRFELPSLTRSKSSTPVKLVIYDLLGREVTTLVNEELKPGTYEVDWDGSNFSSGVYFYKIISNDFVETKKMVLMK